MMLNRIWQTTITVVMVLTLTTRVGIAAPPPGKGGGKDGSGTTGPQFVLEVTNMTGAYHKDLNDYGDLLLEESVNNGTEITTKYYLGTLDSGVRMFEQVQLPPGWNSIEIAGMNNSRELVGAASYDPEGDGLDVDVDGVLDLGNILRAGIVVTPDADNDGIWEMTVLFPGPYSGYCAQINNNGDIVGQDDAFEVNLLLRYEGTSETFPIFPHALGLSQTLSDRDGNGDLAAIMQGSYYLPRKYETLTGEVTILPTFDRATVVDAYAFAINSSGEVVGRADRFPAYWSPSGEVSKIPGWSKSKNATGYAFGINEWGEIIITSYDQGPHLYRPVDGLHPLSNAITNPEAIPAGYQLSRLMYINNSTQIAAELRSDSGLPIPCVLHPVEQP